MQENTPRRSAMRNPLSSTPPAAQKSEHDGARDNTPFLTDYDITEEADVPTFIDRAREGLWLSHRQIARYIDRILADAPEVDGGDHYTKRGAGYEGWRDGLPAFSENYLRGFRAGVNHAGRVVLNGGGSAPSSICECRDEEPEQDDDDA